MAKESKSKTWKDNKEPLARAVAYFELQKKFEGYGGDEKECFENAIRALNLMMLATTPIQPAPR